MDSIEFRFAFYARDFEKSLDFYQNILEMKYVGGWDREDGKGALLSVGGTAVIEIYGAAEGRSYDGPSPTALKLAVRFDKPSEVDAFFQYVAGKGVDRCVPPQNQAWGHRAFIVYDPDGIPIHFYSELK